MRTKRLAGPFGLAPRMAATVMIVVCSLPLLAESASANTQPPWFTFNKSFIAAHYASGMAIGELKVKTWVRGVTPHSSKCGIDDGGLSIGIMEADLDVPAEQSPTSGPADWQDNRWGVVVELPNGSLGSGPADLDKAVGAPA